MGADELQSRPSGRVYLIAPVKSAHLLVEFAGAGRRQSGEQCEHNQQSNPLHPFFLLLIRLLSATAIHGTGIKALRLMHWPLQVKEAGSSDRLDNGIPQKVQSGLLPARHARTWAALYQQRPAPEEGDYFKADWLRVVERGPPNLRTWGSSDYAVSSGRGD